MSLAISALGNVYAAITSAPAASSESAVGTLVPVAYTVLPASVSNRKEMKKPSRSLLKKYQRGNVRLLNKQEERLKRDEWSAKDNAQNVNDE
ncbi:hypothetical protein K0M31_000465 [Melipona bicolor]|uniref:Uncharacterized protein n=1 Tax=Melipona bicolor TaxID=60889 RepID=A0AA40GDL7_9HYME|nr:hypothetical protein K0M31_000465 [Melipona bicolor]